ncbi:ABC-three component system protein [Pseudomonas aeruginosa]|uniref:ABC-three component system protein n=1 Tax=Pseudomonas aeruginosa TaxID=287 RepID=UPI004046DA59
MAFGESTIKLPPPPEFELTALDVEKGEPVHPLDRLQIMSPDAWEVFTLEFVSYLGNDYESVTRCAGAGDKGRDVIAKFSSGWDNYQYKHYKDKLSIADVVAELGKLVYYTWRGDYTLPREYRFVSPKGCSSHCIDMLAKKARIKAEIIKRWDKVCKDKITKTESIPLQGALLDYLNGLDFSFVDEMSSQELIDKHARTPYHTTRFGSYHLKRPPARKPEPGLADNEKVYVDALLSAFSDADGAEYSFSSVMDTEYKDDMERARINFYSAESLEMFSRDAFPTDCYEKLKSECHEGVHSIVRKKFDDGYQRFLEVSTQSVNIPYDSHPLRHFLQTADRKGLCHQLVNDLKFEWIKK